MYIHSITAATTLHATLHERHALATPPTQRWLHETGGRAVTMQAVHGEAREELGQILQMARALREKSYREKS